MVDVAAVVVDMSPFMLLLVVLLLLLLRQLLFSNTEGSVGSCVAIIVMLSVLGNNIYSYGTGRVDG